jgi:hypothetical protein
MHILKCPIGKNGDDVISFLWMWSILSTKLIFPSTIQLSNQFGLPHFTIPSLFPSTIQWIFYLEFVPRNSPPTIGTNNKGKMHKP